MISFIIATYNSERTLEDCLRSFELQNTKNFELHIIDGGSTDNTLKIIEKFGHVLSTSISEQDNGIYDAWNKGLNFVSGSYIAFLGSDDKLRNQNSIANLNAITEKHTQDFLYGISTVVNHQGETIRRNGEPWEKIRANFFKGIMQLPHQGMLHKTTVFDRIGRFNEQYKISGDYDFLLRALLDRESIAFTTQHSEIIVKEGGVSHDYKMRLSSLDEVVQILKSKSINPASFRFNLYQYRTRTVYFLSKFLGAPFLNTLKKRLLS